MPDIERRAPSLLQDLVRAVDGSGPLLQRDYWAVIDRARLTPTEIADCVARDFARFAPEALVRFERVDRRETPLAVGDEMRVHIRLAGDCRVRVLHRSEQSVTLGTLDGHPEAGRITFGAYRNEAGDIVFHIRSRARSASGLHRRGFITAGEPMQTTTWTDFVDRLAHAVGAGVVGVIHAETCEIEDESDDPVTSCSPTFVATEA